MAVTTVIVTWKSSFCHLGVAAVWCTAENIPCPVVNTKQSEGADSPTTDNIGVLHSHNAGGGSPLCFTPLQPINHFPQSSQITAGNSKMIGFLLFKGSSACRTCLRRLRIWDFRSQSSIMCWSHPPYKTNPLLVVPTPNYYGQEMFWSHSHDLPSPSLHLLCSADPKKPW